jgi:serine/threonine-protein kinase
MAIDGRFLLTKRIGQGGFGTVWAATDVDTGEDVAIKFVHPEHRSNSDVMERFEIEAEALARLDHPGITRALGWRGHKTLAYLAMEYLRGQTLAQVIRTFARDERPISEGTAVQVFRQIASALDHAHGKQILHRDLKPSNVMVTQRGEAMVLKLMDFGLAKILDGTRPPTTVGRTMGTFFYMAPEQVMHEPADPRTDVFALGVTMFELLTFRRAWALDEDGRPSSLLEDALKLEANGPNKLLRRIVTSAPPRPRTLRPDLSPWLAGIVEIAMAPARADRFPSAAAVLAALDSPLVLSPRIRPAMTSGAIAQAAERPLASASLEEPLTVPSAQPLPPPSEALRARPRTAVPFGRPLLLAGLGATVACAGSLFWLATRPAQRPQHTAAIQPKLVATVTASVAADLTRPASASVAVLAPMAPHEVAPRSVSSSGRPAPHTPGSDRRSSERPRATPRPTTSKAAPPPAVEAQAGLTARSPEEREQQVIKATFAELSERARKLDGDARAGVEATLELARMARDTERQAALLRRALEAIQKAERHP